MKKTPIHLAAIVLAFSMAAPTWVHAHDNWISSSGDVWRSADGRCWRDAAWTPQTAAPNCEGGTTQKASGRPPIPVPPPKVTPAPAAPAPTPEPAVVPAAPAPKPVAAAPAPVAVKAAPVQRTLAADALFDVDKSVVKAAGLTKLDALARELQGARIESLLVIGHTDSTGSDAYNQALSQRRAKAVLDALVARGIPASVVKAEGRGESQPVADNRTRDGRAANRRVDIEVRAVLGTP